jgi:hypothetical protein
MQNRSSAVMQQRVEPHVVSIVDAKAAGLAWYFTGLPCPHGHVAKRSVSNRDCRACVNMRMAATRAKCPDKIRSKERHRYLANRETKREQMRQSRLRHVEKRRAEDRNRYHKNPEPKRAQARSWWKTDSRTRGLFNKRVQGRRARVKSATPPWLTTEQREAITRLYVEAAAREGEWHVDHMVPLRGATVCGLHVPWNLQILAGDDNRRKSNALQSE